MSFRNLLAVTALIALAACGGGNNQSSSSSAVSSPAKGNGIMTDTSANPSPSTGANAPMGGMNANGEPMAPGTLATQPPGLSCGAVQPVWVNTKSHVYHVSTDPLYGRTKHGQYMCPSQAVKEGYHKAAGGKHHHASSSDSTNQ